MPLYSYICSIHGSFDVIQPLGGSSARCPECKRLAQKIMTRPARITVSQRENLPYGSGSRGRYISSEETGGIPILIPSWGAMEKAEIDYVAEGAIEKEKERVRNKRERNVAVKQKISSYLDLAYQTKPGQRAKVLKEAMKEAGDL